MKNTQGQCWECDAVGEVHHHHVVPRSRGGTRTVPLCLACHAHAHHRKKAMSTPELTREGIAKAKAAGRHHGSPPLGFVTSVRGTLAPNESEARTVARIVELRTAGMSLRAIAEVLTAEGHATKTGATWFANTVRRVALRAGVDCTDAAGDAA